VNSSPQILGSLLELRGAYGYLRAKPLVTFLFRPNHLHMPAVVAIYTTPWCPYCHRAKSLLSRKGVVFDEIDAEDRPDLRRWLEQASGQSTVPQVFINNQPVGGYTDISSLDRSGVLDVKLREVPPASLPSLPR
jgi:glutaredoxin 3